jgi:hypothetical protein
VHSHRIFGSETDPRNDAFADAKPTAEEDTKYAEGDAKSTTEGDARFADAKCSLVEGVRLIDCGKEVKTLQDLGPRQENYDLHLIPKRKNPM